MTKSQCSRHQPPCPKTCSRVSKSSKAKAHCRKKKTSSVAAVGSRAHVKHGKAKHTKGGLTKADLKKKDGRYISVKKSEAAKKTSALKKWVKAAKAEGYLQKGEGFKKLPKKGSAAYKKIRARYASM